MRTKKKLTLKSKKMKMEATSKKIMPKKSSLKSLNHLK
jgi:hypothetical protein